MLTPAQHQQAKSPEADRLHPVLRQGLRACLCQALCLRDCPAMARRADCWAFLRRRFGRARPGQRAAAYAVSEPPAEPHFSW